MTTIKATCPLCGDVELTPAQVRLVVASVAEMSYYAFPCSTCSEEIRKPADENVIALLVTGGVRPQRWEIPAEALEERSGPVLTYDDVLDFVLELSQIDALAAVVGPRVTT